MPTEPRLAVFIDGTPVPPDEGRALWDRFSAHMDAHPGDLAGFAQAEGFSSVHPAAEAGRAILRISRVEPQRPYGAPNVGGSTGGSSSGQERGARRKKTR
jgi:hypothetical protein